MEKVVRFKLHKHKKQWITIGVVTIAGTFMFMISGNQVSASTTAEEAPQSALVNKTEVGDENAPNVTKAETSETETPETSNSSSESVVPSVTTSEEKNAVGSDETKSSATVKDIESVVQSSTTGTKVSAETLDGLTANQNESIEATETKQATTENNSTQLPQESAKSADQEATSDESPADNVLPETEYVANNGNKETSHLQTLPLAQNEDGYTKLTYTATVHVPTEFSDGNYSTVQMVLSNGADVAYMSLRGLGADKPTLALIRKVGSGGEETLSEIPINAAKGDDLRIKLDYDKGMLTYFEWPAGTSEASIPTGNYYLKLGALTQVGIRTWGLDAVAVHDMSVTNTETEKFTAGDVLHSTALPSLDEGKNYNELNTQTQIVIPGADENSDAPFMQLALQDTKAKKQLYLELTANSDGTQSLVLVEKDGSSARHILSDSAKKTNFTAGTKLNLAIEYREGKAWFRYWEAGKNRPTASNAGAITDFKSFAPDTIQLVGSGIKADETSAPSFDSLVAGAPIDFTTQGTYFDKVDQYTPPTWEEAQKLLPEVVTTDNPEYEELYEGAWKVLFETNLFKPENNPEFSTYVGSGFEPQNMTFQWDSIFAMFFAKYANQAIDPMSSLNNFYISQDGYGSISRIYNVADGSVQGWATGVNNVNPPIFAYAELQSYLLTGDKDRLAEIKDALQAYADWVSIEKWSQNTEHQLYWNNGNGNGMDNLPTQANQAGDGTGTGDVDMSSQMVLMWRSLAQIDTILGDTANAARNTALADDLANRINNLDYS
ncbi:KxYKxGKxW signal peptide domain-containing protein [Lacticaseibacillus sp. N501-2]|uniref:KxYKxGKxW signal peptide domain-containing protein n=1 Tax=Lacticaseibacillus salsurae TaxID=3367729 RepID=UPI0038B3782C